MLITHQTLPKSEPIHAAKQPSNFDRGTITLVAEVFGLTDRGIVHEDAAADPLFFDPGTVIDRAGYTEAEQPVSGIRLVIVNGQAVWNWEARTGGKPGRFLRRETDRRERPGHWRERTCVEARLASDANRGTQQETAATTPA